MSAISPNRTRASASALGTAAPARRAAMGALVAAVGCWSVLVAGWRMNQLHPPVPGSLMKLLFYGVPLGMAILLALRPGFRTRELGAATAWVVTIAAAFALAPHLTSSSTYAIAVPAALLAAWIVA